MGGNAAEAHPCGFKWVTEAKANRGAKLIVVDPRFTRSASVADVYAPIRQGTDIAFLLGRHQLLHPERQGAVGVRQELHQRALHREGGLRLPGRPVHRLRRVQARLRPVDLELRDGRGRLRQSRRHAARSAMRLEPAEGARQGLHARDGRAHLRHAEGQVPEDLPDDRRDVGARQGHDVDVRARLDPALQGLAEHPRHGDAAAHPGQHRRAWRRHERLARSLQHPGADRPRAHVEPDPGLSHAGRRSGSRTSPPTSATAASSRNAPAR